MSGEWSDRLRYGATAAALKLGSVSPRLYRFLGNRFGQRRRVRDGMPEAYGARAAELLDWCRRHALVRDGDAVLELGTGWVHFESLVLRMFFDVRATLFDVWDNRQLDALRRYAADLAERLPRRMRLEACEERRVRDVAARVARCGSFDELYRDLGFTYVVDPRGVLDALADGSFDFVYSNNVLEHVRRDVAPALIAGVRRVLRRRGRSLHNIDIGDHLVTFGRARGLSPKHYLRYDDRTWRRRYENRVQYVNRLQRSEWAAMFRDAGLVLIDEDVRRCALDGLPVAEAFAGFDRDDLACTRWIALHGRP